MGIVHHFRIRATALKVNTVETWRDKNVGRRNKHVDMRIDSSTEGVYDVTFRMESFAPEAVAEMTRVVRAFRRTAQHTGAIVVDRTFTA